MPRAQYVVPSMDVCITRGFATPKRYQDHWAWMIKVRKAIPEIPEQLILLHEPDIDQKHIKWTFSDGQGVRHHIVVDRTWNNVTQTPL